VRTGEFQGFNVQLDEYGICVVTFNQPDRMNGSNQAMKRDLTEILLQAQMSDDVRVVVLTGSGRAFSAGDDMTGTTRDHEPTLVPTVPRGHGTPIGTYDALRLLSQQVNLAVRNLDKVTIAAINGYAIQTGLSLALACDFRIAAREAKLGSATLRFGLLPDEGGHFLLVQTLGLPKALDFMLRKRIVTAEEALSIGLVHEVVDGAQLMDAAMEMAREFADGPQVATRLLKRSIYLASEISMEQSFEDIATKAAISDHHPDAQEGGGAFREKREPKFA
jgi:2-(1,2-epoxy-1,2-dihydrophenyl)acetyl-CoA isomerase